MTRRRRVLADMSVGTRLSLVALLVVLLSLAVTAAVGLRRGNELADGLAEDRLVTVAASRGASVDSYLTGVRREMASLALSPGTRSAIDGFAGAYLELPGTPASAAATRTLTEFYLDEIVPPLEAVRGGPVGLSSVLPTGSAAITLQSLYTVPADPDDGDQPVDPALVTDPGDGSEYSELHAAAHPVFQRIAALSSFDDLMLIEARSELVVYTVRKRTDFATSLAVGPLSGSSLSTLIDKVGEDPRAGEAGVIDFAAYPPAGDRPRMFVASPVFDTEGAVMGYIAGSLATGPFDTIMSGDGEWQGFGDTGEAYLVGGDGTMRTTSRAYAAAPTAFTAAASEPGANALTDDQRRRIEATGTTALIQPIPRETLTLADEGSGTTRTANYRDIDVVTSYRPLDIDGLDWTVIADVETGEIDEPIEDYARNMLFAVALFVVVVTFLAVRWSDAVIAPIRAIAARLRSARAGTLAASDGRSLPDGSPIEYVELSEHIDQMLERLRERRLEVEARAEERARLVAEFLPTAAARRNDVGDDVLDHAANATAAVIVLGGIGDLVEGQSERRVRDALAEIIEHLDDLTAEFGLERVMIAGNAYVAVCGVSRPFLDHVPRSVEFALAAVELVGDLIGEAETALGVGAGVDSGTISVGLAGRTGLVYDAWGGAVTGATELARGAPSRGVAVSAAVREQLPQEYTFAGGEATGSSAVVTGRVREDAT